ncbi:MAG: hypothetical protein AB7O24_20695 [Kofleriaceae bacterium]
MSSRRWAVVAVGVVAVGCAGDPPDEMDDPRVPSAIEQICTGLTACGTLVEQEPELCVSELGAVTPASALDAVEHCAMCVEATACGEIKAGGCKAACDPLLVPINSAVGTASAGCTAVSTANQAIRNKAGELQVELDCPGFAFEVDGVTMEADEVAFTPGPYFEVGVTKACGQFKIGRTLTAPSMGTFSIATKQGRRWIMGSCSVGDTTISFEVPFRFKF